jgi:hypothetical protein
MTGNGCSRRNGAVSTHLDFDQETERSSPCEVAAQQFCNCVAIYWYVLWLWPFGVNASPPLGSKLWGSGLSFIPPGILPPSLLKVNSTLTGIGRVCGSPLCQHILKCPVSLNTHFQVVYHETCCEGTLLGCCAEVARLFQERLVAPTLMIPGGVLPYDLPLIFMKN